MTPRLSRKLHQTLGEEADDLVSWMQQMEGPRSEWSELRRDADARFTQVDARFTRVDATLAALHEEMRVGFSDLRQEMAHLETRLERRIGDLIKWSFVFWVGAVGAIAMLAGVLR